MRFAAATVLILLSVLFVLATTLLPAPFRQAASPSLGCATALAQGVRGEDAAPQEAGEAPHQPSLGGFILAILLRLIGFFFTTWLGLFILVGVIIPALSASAYSWGRGRSRIGYLRLKLVNPIDTAARYELAQTWIGARRYRAAERVLKEALAVCDDEARVHFAYARVLFHLRRYGDAIAQAERAKEIDANFGYGDVEVLAGNALLNMDRPKEALAAYDEALSRNTSEIQARFKAAVAASRIGDGAAARKYLGDLHQAFIYLPPYARRKSWPWWTLAAVFPIARWFF